MLTVHNLTKRFDPAASPVVCALDFEVEEGEIFALLGASGCGKTTTLRLIAGFEQADSGTISIGDQMLTGLGHHTPPEQRGVGLVFQDYALFPHLKVFDNIAFGLRTLPRKERRKRAQEVLVLVGLEGYEKRMPHALSGGQQQRVAIARTLAPRPALILLDEPFSNLDAQLRQATRLEIRSLLKQEGMTAVLVTHDQEEALSFADRVAVMRDGRIEQVGTPEHVYHNPRTRFVALFLGQTNLLLSEADGRKAMTPLGPIALRDPIVGQVLLSMRPEHLTLDRPAAVPEGPVGQVVERAFKGHDITFRVALGGSEYLIHTHNRMPFQVGDAVCVRALEPAVVLEERPDDSALLSGLAEQM